MRACWFSLTMVGCVGSANLGAERVRPELDGGAQELDGGAPSEGGGPLEGAVVGVQIVSRELSENCGACFQLTAQTTAAAGSYALSWDDGSSSESRRVCPSRATVTYRVTLRDKASGQSASASLPLAPRSGTCGPAGGIDTAMLCLLNGSFERISPLPSLPSTFDAAPWLACGTATPNLPQILDDESSSLVPKAPDGHTYLSLAVNEQVAQTPCASIPVGSPRSFRIELAELTGGLVSDSAPVLEVWGGLSLDCSQRELLWSSPPLTSGWQSYCVTIEPQQALESLTLRATTSSALPSPIRVLVDQIEPVAACP